MSFEGQILKSTAPFIKIYCGVCGDETQAGSDLFWPVLEAIELPVHVSFEARFSLVFTSKKAVSFFFKKYIHALSSKAQQIHFLSQLDFVGAVGESTKKWFHQEFESIFGPSHSVSVATPGVEGLKNLLTAAPLRVGSLLFVVTVLQGKTQATLAALKGNGFNFPVQVVPIYDLRNYESPFLKGLFGEANQGNLQKFNYVFCCQSGKVLERTLIQLYTFFSCSQAEGLPAGILFQIEKDSTLAVAQSQGIMKRVILSDKGKLHDK